MPGFGNDLNNRAFESGVFDFIATHLIQCSRNMRNDCMKSGKLLPDNENKITNRLVEKYLNSNDLMLGFTAQSLENFLPDEDRYEGQIDIKVMSPDWFSDRADYYIIECKRIDGTAGLNRKYVSEGVLRFFGNPPKYSSHHNRNIMFGYVIKAIDIPENKLKIEKIQNSLLKNVITRRFSLMKNLDPEWYLYSCRYQFDADSIELAHLFYDFSAVMQHSSQ